MSTETEKEDLRTLGKQIEKLGLDYNHMLEAGYDGIVYHFDGQIVQGNQAFADMIECTVEDTIGLNAFKLYPPESIDTVMKNLQEATEDPYEVEALTMTGKQFRVSIWGMNFYMNGQMGRVIGTKKVGD